MLINSIHNIEDSKVSHFSDVLEYLYDTLSLDYNSLNYFTNSIDIIGKEIYLIGLKFVYFILKDIKLIKEDLEMAAGQVENGKNANDIPTQAKTNYEETLTTYSAKETYANVQIVLGIENFLSTIDSMLEIYEERYDIILTQINSSNRIQYKQRLSEQKMEGGLIKGIFKEIADAFSMIAKGLCKIYFINFHQILIFMTYKQIIKICCKFEKMYSKI